ncbi:WG repeat-containing protein [uncultured Winogradskyella sp.]|uniref:WG repeat-containing protein n=1 Tax=uncultured Winogradskyella sp. TaxID=395353 RepID=UPI0030DA31C8|tara:strand:- start:25595 stop:26206 length:612 start_codon:yes stop_codon:yes gene_type:complete
MKKVLILFLVFAVNPFFGYAQSIENLDFISPFYNGLAAIKKDGQWAFVNTKGDVIINYRTDLVLTKSNENSYPIFNDDRCLIEQKKNGISYFGYIDTSGKTIIEPKFLNATNFNNGKAIVLELIKENVGKNEALGKNIVYYKYFEVIINTNGVIENYINPSGVNVVIDKEFLRMPPKITSKLISDNLVAIKGENGKWSLVKLN